MHNAHNDEYPAQKIIYAIQTSKSRKAHSQLKKLLESNRSRIKNLSYPQHIISRVVNQSCPFIPDMPMPPHHHEKRTQKICIWIDYPHFISYALWLHLKVSLEKRIHPHQRKKLLRHKEKHTYYTTASNTIPYHPHLLPINPHHITIFRSFNFTN